MPVSDLQDDEIRTDLVFEVFGAVQSHDPSPVDDRHPVTEVVGLLHVVGGDDHGHPLRPVHILDIFPDVPPGLGVQTQRGLVQEQDVGMVHQASGDLQPPLHPARVVLQENVGLLSQVYQVQNILDPLLPQAGVHAVHPAVEVQVLPARELAVHAGILEDHPDGAAHGVPLSADIMTPDQGAAIGGPDHCGEHLDYGALARAVGSQEAKEFALLDMEIHLVHGGEPVEPHGQTARGDRRLIHDPKRPIADIIGCVGRAGSATSSASIGSARPSERGGWRIEYRKFNLRLA